MAVNLKQIVSFWCKNGKKSTSAFSIVYADPTAQARYTFVESAIWCQLLFQKSFGFQKNLLFGASFYSKIVWFPKKSAIWCEFLFQKSFGFQKNLLIGASFYSKNRLVSKKICYLVRVLIPEIVWFPKKSAIWCEFLFQKSFGFQKNLLFGASFYSKNRLVSKKICYSVRVFIPEIVWFPKKSAIWCEFLFQKSFSFLKNLLFGASFYSKNRLVSKKICYLVRVFIPKIVWFPKKSAIWCEFLFQKSFGFQKNLLFGASFYSKNRLVS